MNINNIIKKKTGIIIAILVLCQLALTGCVNKRTEIILTTDFKNGEVFRLEDSSCYLPEIMVYLVNSENKYDEIFGENIWNVPIVTETLSTTTVGNAYNDTVFMDGSLAGGVDGVGKAQTHIAPGEALSGTTITAEWGNEHFVTIEAIDDTDLSKGYVIKSHSTTTPYFYYTSNKNGMSGTANKNTAATYPISVVFNNENDIDIALGGNATGAILHYNAIEGATGEMFRFYKDGGQQNIYLYKKIDSGITTYTAINPIYTRTVTADEYGTICLPYASSETSGATFYSIAGKKNEGSSIVLNEVGGNLEAGTPYIFKANGSTITVTFTGEPVAEAKEANGLIGTFVTIDNLQDEWTKLDDIYVISGTKFYFVNSAVKCEAYRAFIAMSDVPNATTEAKGDVELFNASAPTDINGVNFVVANASARYNIAGQKVNSSYKGIVIMNGKKYLNK